MSTFDLGTLLRVELRDVWKHEAIDFTPWLVEHIAVLGAALGLDLEVVGSEHSVGDFAADILARDLGRNKLVVIENQLEETDHSHLGQLITYCAGLDASVVVWVSRHIREEHREALDWLNRAENGRAEYFGVVIELLQIDSSKPAVNLRVVASPNRWSRSSKRGTTVGDASGKYELYRQFFQLLIDELRDKHRFTNARIGQPQNWYSFSTGTRGFQYGASFAMGAKMRAEVYIDLGDLAVNLAALRFLEESKVQFEQAFGSSLSWEPLENKRACRIASYRVGTIEDSAEALEEYRRWMIEMLLKFRSVFGQYLPKAAEKASTSVGQVVASSTTLSD